MGRLVPIRQGLQEGDDLIFFLIRQTQLANRLIDILRDFRRRPARDLLSWIVVTLASS